MTKKQYFHWHRRLAILIGVPVLLWAVSGILHPLMSNWFKVDIPQKFIRPSSLVTENIQPPAKILPQNLAITFLKLVEIEGKMGYLIQEKDQSFSLFDARYGRRLSLNDYLEQKARFYLKDEESELKSITLIQNFNSTYAPINRYLPVYRVALDRTDGHEVVIDPRTGKLARHDQPHIRTMKTLFAWFHSYSFLGSVDSIIRATIVSVLSFLALLLGVTGIANLILFSSKRASGGKRKLSLLKRFHRVLGGLSFVFYLLFGISGFVHALSKLKPQHYPQLKSQKVVLSQDLETVPQSPQQPSVTSAAPASYCSSITSATLALIEDVPYYRIQTSGGVFYQNATDGLRIKNGESKHLKELTERFLPAIYKEPITILNSEKVTAFSKTYGFIDRRLPVWKQALSNGDFLYIDVKDNAVAKLRSSDRRIEGFIFSMFHKFHFIDALNKELRDWVSVIAAASIALLSLLGFLMLIKK